MLLILLMTPFKTISRDRYVPISENKEIYDPQYHEMRDVYLVNSNIDNVFEQGRKILGVVNGPTKGLGGFVVQSISIYSADDHGNYYKYYEYPTAEKVKKGFERHLKKQEKFGWKLQDKKNDDTGWVFKNRR